MMSGRREVNDGRKKNANGRRKAVCLRANEICNGRKGEKEIGHHVDRNKQTIGKFIKMEGK